MFSDFIPADKLAEFEKSYFEELGILGPEGVDRRRAERAFERACTVRDFEIELYWKRATYFWGFQAAFLATIAVLLTGGIVDSWAPLFAGIVALAAFVVSWNWADMSRGAKFWQNNWERHVDMLEPYFTGDLYRLYPASGQLKRPPSVSRINQNVILALTLMWLMAYAALGIAASTKTPFQTWGVSPVLTFCLQTLLVPAMLCLIKICGTNFADDPNISDQVDATFAVPVKELPSGAVLHKRRKLG